MLQDTSLLIKQKYPGFFIDDLSDNQDYIINGERYIGEACSGIIEDSFDILDVKKLKVKAFYPFALDYIVESYDIPQNEVIDLWCEEIIIPNVEKRLVSYEIHDKEIQVSFICTPENYKRILINLMLLRGLTEKASFAYDYYAIRNHFGFSPDTSYILAHFFHIYEGDKTYRAHIPFSTNTSWNIIHSFKIKDLMSHVRAGNDIHSGTKGKGVSVFSCPLLENVEELWKKNM